MMWSSIGFSRGRERGHLRRTRGSASAHLLLRLAAVAPRPAAAGLRAGPDGGLDLGLDRRLAGEGVVGDGELDRLEALDLVAEAGGFLELEVLGGLEHRLAQAVEVGGEVGADQRLVDAGGDAGLVGVALEQAVEHVGDVLADGLGGDAVGEL